MVNIGDNVKVLFYNNDNLLEIIGLKNAATDSFINNATVTADIHLKSDDSQVTGATGLTLAYVSGSNGNYRTTVPDTANIAQSEEYVAKITADGGAGLKGYWEILIQSQVRYE